MDAEVAFESPGVVGCTVCGSGRYSAEAEGGAECAACVAGNNAGASGGAIASTAAVALTLDATVRCNADAHGQAVFAAALPEQVRQSDLMDMACI